LPAQAKNHACSSKDHLVNALKAPNHKQDKEHDQDRTDQTTTNIHQQFLPDGWQPRVCEA
jgi:hypothetical protein